MKIIKKAAKILLILILIILMFFAGLFIYHRICTEKEKALISQPLGDMIDVNGHKMCVYSGGNGEKTLVFLSGFGNSSPILDFRSLYSLLEGDYRIAVVEKFGYGFSDDFDADRSVEAMLSDTRSALAGAGIEAPYVLCPHSFSGTEAIYWAQTYPEEVEAIISLDAIVPGMYDIVPIDHPLEGAAKFASDTGFIRLTPDDNAYPAVGCGTLTDEEKKIYLALTHSRFRTKAMMNEIKACERSLETVSSGNVPDVPLLYFIGDMGITDGETLKKYRQLHEKYAGDKGVYIYLDCGHSVHNFEYVRIAEDIREFLGDSAENASF